MDTLKRVQEEEKILHEVMEILHVPIPEDALKAIKRMKREIAEWKEKKG